MKVKVYFLDGQIIFYNNVNDLMIYDNSYVIDYNKEYDGQRDECALTEVVVIIVDNEVVYTMKKEQG